MAKDANRSSKEEIEPKRAILQKQVQRRARKAIK